MQGGALPPTGKGGDRVQMESFSLPQLPPGACRQEPGRDKSRGDFALCLEGLVYHFSPSCNFAGQTGRMFDVYRSKVGVPLDRGFPEKSGGKGAQTGCEEPGYPTEQNAAEMTPDEHGDEQGEERPCPGFFLWNLTRARRPAPVRMRRCWKGRSQQGWQEEALLQLEIVQQGRL